MDLVSLLAIAVVSSVVLYMASRRKHKHDCAPWAWNSGFQSSHVAPKRLALDQVSSSNQSTSNPLEQPQVTSNPTMHNHSTSNQTTVRRESCKPRHLNREHSRSHYSLRTRARIPVPSCSVSGDSDLSSTLQQLTSAVQTINTTCLPFSAHSTSNPIMRNHQQQVSQ